MTLLAALAVTLPAQAPRTPWTPTWAGFFVHLYGTFEMLGVGRSAALPVSVNTPFGSIPLRDTDAQYLLSGRHSVMALAVDRPAGPLTFRTYLENDFMNTAPGESPWRWRQYYTRAVYGHWELLGGKAWSLLRPNRAGLDTDRNLMNTDVVEPAYQVGLAGSRRRQIRLGRTFGSGYAAAVAWEGVGNTVAKLVRDTQRLHWEAQGLRGTQDRYGVGWAAVYKLSPHWRLVTQQFAAHRALNESMGLVPAGTSGVSSLQGVESNFAHEVELYAYAGFVRAPHSTGNSLVSQWSAGVNQTTTLPLPHMRLRLSMQYSHVGRATWDHRSGTLDYLMASVRLLLNGPPRAILPSK
jgi:hypothetical protein